MEHDAAIYFCDQFRDARERALHDAEAYQEVLFSIERFGSTLSGEIGTLGTYGKWIILFGGTNRLNRTSSPPLAAS